MKNRHLLHIQLLTFACIYLLQGNMLKAQNILLPAQQILAYPVVVHSDSLDSKKDGDNNNWINSINVHSISFSESIRNSLLNGEINTYKIYNEESGEFWVDDLYNKDYHFTPLNFNELLQIGQKKEYIHVEKEPGVYIDTTIIHEASWQENIPELYFFETWDINSDNNTFNKNVQCILPIYYEIINGKVRKNQFCAINFDYSEKELRKIRKKAVLSKKIKYEYSFSPKWINVPEYSNQDSFINPDAPFLNSIIQNRLIDFIFENAKSQKIIPHDFYSNETISHDELKDRLEDEFIYTYESKPGIFKDSTITVSYKNDEIQSLYFIEEWYISKDPFMVFKEVIGAAPVRHQIDNNTGLIRKTVPFTIYFDEKKRF